MVDIFFNIYPNFYFNRKIYYLKTLAWMRAKGLNQKNILFIGTKSEFNKIKNSLDKANWSGFNAKSHLESINKLLIKADDFLRFIKKKKYLKSG